MNDLLVVSLEVAVPLWIAEVSKWDSERREAKARECGAHIAEKGDRILFKSKRKGETAEAFNALACGIACLAFAPGGVTVFGRTWKAGPQPRVPPPPPPPRSPRS